MALPPDWKTSNRTLPKDDNEKFLGHEDQGGTIALHSLAVLPEHQNKGIGSTLLKSYVDRIKEARIADRIALIAHEPMMPFYEKYGFQQRGKSEVQHGGGGWYDMVRFHGFDTSHLVIMMLTPVDARVCSARFSKIWCRSRRLKPVDLSSIQFC